MTTADERFYKRKLNEMEQDIKRLQREVLKLKALRRNASRSNKHINRMLQREADLQEVFDTMQEDEFAPVKVETKPTFTCKSCHSDYVQVVAAGNRVVVVCQDCTKRYTIKSQEPLAQIA